MKIVQKIQLKIVIFTPVKNRCMLHGRVRVMVKQINKIKYHEEDKNQRRGLDRCNV